MTREKLQSIFFSATELLDGDDDDAICIGSMLPSYSPVGVEQIMKYNTSIADALLALPNLSALQTVSILSMRFCTFHEYRNVLFDTRIREKDFGAYNCIRCFFFSSDKERREKVIYMYNRDSYADYLMLLHKMVQKTHPLIFSFLFDDESER